MGAFKCSKWSQPSVFSLISFIIVSSSSAVSLNISRRLVSSPYLQVSGSRVLGGRRAMQGVFGLGRDRNYLSCRRKVLLSGGNNWLVKSGLVFRHLLRDMPWNEESKRRGPGITTTLSRSVLEKILNAWSLLCSNRAMLFSACCLSSVSSASPAFNSSANHVYRKHYQRCHY